MKLSLGDIFNVGEKKYIVIEKCTFTDIDYIFVNKLTAEEEPTNDFYVYKENKNGVVLITDKNVLDIVLPIFSNKLQNDVTKKQIEEQYNIV